MSVGDAPRVAIIGDGWTTHVVEDAIAAAGYAAERLAIDDPGGEIYAAAVVVGDDLDGVHWARVAGTPCLAVWSRPAAESELLDAVRAGADALVSETDGMAVVLETLRVVVGGGLGFTPQVARRLVVALREELELARPRVQLTARQYAVLELIARGESVKQTARSLGIAVKTVENTQSRLYRRLGVRNRSQAIAVALSEGLIEADLVGSVTPTVTV